MKYITLILAAAFTQFAANAQYELSFTKANVNNGKFEVTVHLAATEKNFSLGMHNIHFNYPSADLGNPVLTLQGKYKNHFRVVNSTIKTGLLALNANTLVGQVDPILLDQQGMDLATVQFDILSNTDEVTLTWGTESQIPKNLVYDFTRTNQKLASTQIPEQTFSLRDKNNYTQLDVLDLYPNPTTNLLHLNLEIENTLNTVDVLISDFTGRTVYANSFSVPSTSFQTEIKVASLPAGNYILNLNENGITHTCHFAKQ